MKSDQPYPKRFSFKPVFSIASLMLLLATLAPQLNSAETLTYTDLVNRMIDLERLAVLPEAGEACAQWSSYNREARYDESTGTYVNWKANGDGTGILRDTDEGQVLGEMKGPGCIWRIWSAIADKGHLKLYLDGKEVPAVDMPYADFFKGTEAPFNYPTLSYNLSAMTGDKARGYNLYLPMPYQKSCKIVAEPGWGRYYHFTYSTFPKGTKVPTFSSTLPPDATRALKKLDTFFGKRLGSDPAGKRKGQKVERSRFSVSPGQQETVFEIDGPRAITALKVKMTFGIRSEERAALRRLILKITFDDQKEASVWCPLGDFFGTAPGVNPYRSLVTGMTNKGFYAFWYMPFAKGAKVELLNTDSKSREARFEVVHAPLTRPFEDMGYFHAKWHRDVMPVSKDRWPDWTVLETEGRGRYCGMMLHVWNFRDQKSPINREAVKIAAPGTPWWGEGDEKFFVDGEKFPSTFGTGTEDYFGYAYGGRFSGFFQTPFHCQPMSERNLGHQSLLRWQVADNVPFQTSFKAYMEKYYPNDWPTRFAVVAIWYLIPGGLDPHGPVAPEELTNYYP